MNWWGSPDTHRWQSSPVLSRVDCTIIASTTARVALACTREHVGDSPYHGGCNMHIDSKYQRN